MIFLKLLISSGSMFGVIFLNLPKENYLRINKTENLKETIQEPTMKTIDDIELFEKKYGCTFGFVGKWDSQQVYSSREFKKNNSSVDLKNIIDGTNSDSHKNKCKEKGVAVLFFNTKTKQFYFDSEKLPGQ